MKKIIIALIIIALTIPIVNYAKQNSQICGQGVILRSNGAVVIDKWIGFDSSPTVPSPTPPKPMEYPTQIVVGSNVTGSINICFELKSGSVCKTVDEVRNLVGKK